MPKPSVAPNADREDHVSCIYYYEHRDLNRNVVEVLSRSLRWGGDLAQRRSVHLTEKPVELATRQVRIIPR
jgi:hypothetical protein